VANRAGTEGPVGPRQWDLRHSRPSGRGTTFCHVTGSTRMLEVLRGSGFPIESRSQYGVVTVDFPTALTDDARDRFERRERLEAQAALHRFFQARSVAVIGASSRRGPPVQGRWWMSPRRSRTSISIPLVSSLTVGLGSTPACGSRSRLRVRWMVPGYT
jgi:hypothetical protein